MKQIEKEIGEINRMRAAIKNTSSRYLIRDYTKSIAQKIKDIKEAKKDDKIVQNKAKKIGFLLYMEIMI